MRLARAQFAGRFAGARISAESAVTVARSLAVGEAAGPASVQDLTLVLILAGKANAAAGGFERAESMLREARQKAQTVVKQGDLMSVIPLAKSEQALGDFYLTRRRTSEARACYQDLVALWRESVGPSEYAARQRKAAEKLLSSIQQ